MNTTELQARIGFEPMTSAITVQRSTNWATCSVVFITARIDSIFVSSTAVHIYDFQIFTGINIQYCLRMYIKLNWYFFSSNISDQQSHYATPNSCQLSWVKIGGQASKQKWLSRALGKFEAVHFYGRRRTAWRPPLRNGTRGGYGERLLIRALLLFTVPKLAISQSKAWFSVLISHDIKALTRYGTVSLWL